MINKREVIVRLMVAAGVVLGVAAILTAIAVPSWLEARIRSRTQMTESNMQAAVTALEAYRVDHGHYPAPVPSGDGWTRFPQVISETTERWSSDPKQLPFIGDSKSLGYALIIETSEQWAPLEGMEPRPAFILLSPGPKEETGAFRLDWNMVYDATNGTLSEGYMFLFGGEEEVPVVAPQPVFTYDPTNGTRSGNGFHRVKQ